MIMSWKAYFQKHLYHIKKPYSENMSNVPTLDPAGDKKSIKHAGPLSKKFGQGEMNTSTTQPAFKNYKVDLL